jgi:N-acetylglucosaminyltransferase
MPYAESGRGDAWVWTGIWKGCIMVGGRFEATKKQSKRSPSTRPEADAPSQLAGLEAPGTVAPEENYRDPGSAARPEPPYSGGDRSHYRRGACFAFFRVIAGATEALFSAGRKTRKTQILIGGEDDSSAGSDDRSLRAARRRAGRKRVRPVASPDVATLTLTVVVPARNEAAGLPETLDALMKQTVAPERIIVVDDGSTDGTLEVAAGYPVEIVRKDVACGTKSRVVNYVLPEIDTDLVMNVDGDTILCNDFIERIKVPFVDPKVAVAAGIVQVWNPKGLFQKSREIEYLLGQHLYRPLQNMWTSPTVCPGCACAFRRDLLSDAGGFPDETIAEDMDYTWQTMIAGYRAVYVAGAECYVIDPKNAQQLKTQLWRWLSGYFQCVRIHWKEIIRRKKVLTLIVLASIVDVFMLPVLLATPFILSATLGSRLIETIAVAWLSTDLLVTVPVVLTGAVRRGINPAWALVNIPLIWVNRSFNFYYGAKALLWEMLLVPLGWKTSLSSFEKGH